MLPMGVAWLACTVMAITFAGIVVGGIGAALPFSAGPIIWTPVVLLGVSVLVVPRAMLIRSAATSETFRANGGRPIGLGWSLALSIGAFAAAMLLAAAVGLAMMHT
jgi:hypothetical protein